jgi:hypothetical protein
MVLKSSEFKSFVPYLTITLLFDNIPTPTTIAPIIPSFAAVLSPEPVTLIRKFEDIIVPSTFAVTSPDPFVGASGFSVGTSHRSLLASRITLPCERGLPSGIWPDF